MSLREEAKARANTRSPTVLAFLLGAMGGAKKDGCFSAGGGNAGQGLASSTYSCRSLSVWLPGRDPRSRRPASWRTRSGRWRCRWRRRCRPDDSRDRCPRTPYSVPVSSAFPKDTFVPPGSWCLHRTWRLRTMHRRKNEMRRFPKVWFHLM